MVYVDDASRRLNIGFRKYIMCHMGADTIAELHLMADKIGIARKYFQGDHYDICKAKRTLAVAMGAKQITQREMVMIVRKR